MSVHATSGPVVPLLRRIPSGSVVGNGLRTAYYEVGTGEPLLLINGGPGFPSEHFAPLADRMAEELQMRIIRYDQRGTGRSDLVELLPQTLTLDLLVEDIEVLREGLGLTTWNVMGHSFGGVLAMMYAVRYPSRVRKLILSAPAGINLDFVETLNRNISLRLTDLQKQQLGTISARSPSLTYEDQLEALSIVLSAYLSNGEHLPRLLDQVVHSRIFIPRVSDLVMQDLVDSNFNLAPALANLTLPVFLIQGTDDPLGKENVRKVRDAIPGASLTLIPNASHYTWIDNPDCYLAALRKCF